jgi:hypothetical protein
MPATHFVQSGSEEMADSETGPGESPEMKHLLKERFRKEMGLLVDVPKEGRSDTTNDGNTARRFFRDPTLSASITRIDETLICRCSVILQALSSVIGLMQLPSIIMLR